MGLTQLEYLNLVGTKVSDAGLYRLHDLERLERLYLWQSKVTAEGAKKLQAALPKAQVNHGPRRGTWSHAIPHTARASDGGGAGPGDPPPP